MTRCQTRGFQKAFRAKKTIPESEIWGPKMREIPKEYARARASLMFCCELCLDPKSSICVFFARMRMWKLASVHGAAKS